MKTRYIVLVFLVLLSVITFLDRLCIAVAGPRMQEDLSITPEQWGWVLGAFVLAYGLFEIPTGSLGDRLGQRRVVTRIVVWWSAFTVLTGSVTGLYPLLAVRFLFGAGEAGAYPNIAGSIARWFPAGERARTQGFIWAAGRAGGAIAPLLVVPIQTRFSWRAAFWIFGLVGLVWSALWWWWYRDRPTQRPGVSQEEIAEIGAHQESTGHAGVPWRALLLNRQFWYILLMYGCYAWGSWFFFSWLHTYLIKGRGFREGEMSFFSALPFTLGVVSNIAGGFLSDVFSRRYGLRAGRRLLGSASLATAAVLLIATAVTQEKTVAAVLLALGFGVMDLMLPSAWAICLDVGSQHAGAITGAMNTAGQLGGFACTVVFGYLVGRTGNYELPLFVIAAMLAVSAALFSRIDPTRPLVPDNQVSAAAHWA